MMDRHRRVACITGATSGIGEAFARRFASDGYNLVITGRRNEKIQSPAKEISDKSSDSLKVILLLRIFTEFKRVNVSHLKKRCTL